MVATVLITQCLQHDFVGIVAPHDPLPNRLHVGHAESLRLLGPDPHTGPLAQLMATLRALPRGTVHVVHIRDWHDPSDPSQRDHLEAFGAHCVQGTRGADFVLDVQAIPEEGRSGVLIDSRGLNDCEGTTLIRELEAIRAASGGALRVGVIGVWTEAKVSFLLYDLKTRLGIDALATCSALTASASRTQHFNALAQLERILGVTCFDSVGSFADWLAPGASRYLPPIPARAGAVPELVGSGAALSGVDRDIIGYLYRDSSTVSLEPLSGGFSGASVFRASATDALGHQQAPSVAKLGPNATIAKERVAFERVEEILGNSAPRVRAFVDLGGRAGIKYSFAAMGHGSVRSLKSLFDSGAPQSVIDRVLREALEEVLGPLYRAARYERLPLLEHYQFSTSWAPAVRQRVAALVGERADAERLDFPGGYSAANLCGFYQEFLRAPGAFDAGFHYVSYVHGDLNGANILVDARDNVWVIDYFHTAPGHVLKDFAKLENDLLYIFTPIGSREVLEEALHITRALRAVKDLRAPLPEKLPGLVSPELLRAWATLRTLRSLGSQYLWDDRDPLQLSVALLRFAAHTLSFDESTPLQKEWALAASCGLAEDIVGAASA